MEQNDFEKIVQGKLDDFQLTPSPSVWTNVGSQLQKEKKHKRLFLFLWFAVFMILAGAAVWYYSSTNDGANMLAKTAADAKATGTPTEINATTAKAVAKPSNDVSATTAANTVTDTEIKAGKNTANDQVNNAGLAQDKLVKPGFISTPKNANLIASSNKVSPSRAQNANLDNAATKAPNQLSSSQNQIDKQTFLATDLTPLVNNRNEKVAAQTPAAVKENTNNTTKEKVKNKDVKKDVLVAAPFASIAPTAASQPATTANAKKAITLKNNKTWSFGFTVFAGISNNVRSLKSITIIDSSLPTTRVPLSLFRLKYTSNLSYGLGLIANRQISKRVGLSLGLNYHYYSAINQIGDKVTGQNTFEDSAFGKTQVGEFFYYGKTATFNNKYHSIELPVDVTFKVNKNSRKPIFLSAGVSPALLIGSNALYANATDYVYYKKEEQFNKLMLSAQTGIMFTVAAKRTHQMTVGPYAQYNFTNMAKSATSTDQHLLFTGIKTNITF